MIGDLTDVMIDNGATVEYEYLRADDGKDYVNINIEDEDLNDIILQFQVSLKRENFKLNAIELNGEEGNDYDINEFIDILMTEYEQYY